MLSYYFLKRVKDKIKPAKFTNTFEILADGDDDREWYEKNQKREWRSGMTQRKSRLVA